MRNENSKLLVMLVGNHAASEGSECHVELVCSRVRIRGSSGSRARVSRVLLQTSWAHTFIADFFSMPSDVQQSRVGYYKLNIRKLELMNRKEMRLLMLRGMESRCIFLAEFWEANWPLSVLPLPCVLPVPWKPQINVAYVDSCFTVTRKLRTEIAFKRFVKSFSMLTRIQI